MSIQNPATLASRLFAADLLPNETRKKICSRILIDEDKINALLDAIETAVRLEAQKFYKFLEALEKDSSMQHLCGKLRSTCGECDHVVMCVRVHPLTSAWCSDVAQLRAQLILRRLSSVSLPPETIGM